MDTNMAAVPLCMNNNMAAVTSRENTLYQRAPSDERNNMFVFNISTILIVVS